MNGGIGKMKKIIVFGSVLAVFSMILITTISGIAFQDTSDVNKEKPGNKELYEQRVYNEQGCTPLQQDTEVIITEIRKTRSAEGIDVTVSTDKQSYQWIVEPVTITVTMTNTGDSLVNLTFPTSQVYDVIIKNKRDTELYRWSDNKFFLQVITEVPFQPGETMSWDVTWYQQGRFFNFLPNHLLIPGTYSIQGILPKIDTIMESDEQEITIRLFP